MAREIESRYYATPPAGTTEAASLHIAPAHALPMPDAPRPCAAGPRLRFYGSGLFWNFAKKLSLCQLGVACPLATRRANW